MSRIDQNGTAHPTLGDNVSEVWTNHIAECEECQSNFPIQAAILKKANLLSDQFEMKKTQDDSVEWYLRQLSETDKQISDLIHKRSSLRETIQARMGKLNEAIYSSDDWFNGDVRGNPVEDRCVEAPAETRSEYNQRRF